MHCVTHWAYVLKKAQLCCRNRLTKSFDTLRFHAFNVPQLCTLAPKVSVGILQSEGGHQRLLQLIRYGFSYICSSFGRAGTCAL